MGTPFLLTKMDQSRRRPAHIEQSHQGLPLLRVVNDLGDFAVQSTNDGLDAGTTKVGEIEQLRAKVARLEARVCRLNQLAHLDPLVNLPNRRSFVTSLERLIARVERYGDPAAMLFVDVNGLKAINDKFGHRAGDEALIEVGRLLAANVRKSDCVGRLGGDEFAILLEHADKTTASHMALRVGEAVVGAQFRVNDNCLPLSVAVGVGAIEPGDNALVIIERADMEMYRAKRAPSSSHEGWAC